MKLFDQNDFVTFVLSRLREEPSLAAVVRRVSKS